MRVVDTAEVIFLVDNATDSLSSSPGFVETEFARLRRRGMPWLSGKCLCCAAHGLSCLITVRTASANRTLLFDTGPEEWVFERNAVRLGVDLGEVGAVMLSHGHWDHAGAMPRALQMITMGNGGRPVPTYMHPDMFALRATKSADGQFRPMELVPSVEVLSGSGADVIVTRDEQLLLDETFYVSGEIPRVTRFERGFPGQYRQTAAGNWELDEVMPDERYLAINVAGKGQIVFTACSHAGLINVLTHARARFPEIPLYGVFGGFHLSGVTEPIIPETVEALAQFDLQLISPGHCTGWRAVSALAAAYGETVAPSVVGKTFLL
ncbi:MAG: MBL fold metallo-hydrolase [Mesorhizobium sp.]|uniref:MBL fold metallo-hydrolase n=1 Tax=Mesorhizobium abyssinicae TaxID=1209958 RepID=A0ABU5ARF6_9HYPH|nr:MULTISPECIES: MBL fold metallo-hydrolase [Mesorhizobium]MDX8539872.1 MBL fold metallo-hydrolase [Mesorhizobium abyssinicae]RUW75663.1 MBL fold metallo-hydrolase [Mesorhizobium sp. M4B.F.Ca.ET.049.02.1.2]RWC94203.1 MAG: MBL fold metallo-hydrolase [Mesorhizobium sp.]